MDSDKLPTPENMESNEHVRFIFGLLDNINKIIDVKLPTGTYIILLLLLMVFIGYRDYLARRHRFAA